jgi:hypothetical protein
MKKVTVIAASDADAIKVCLDIHGWYPSAVREVDSGDEGTKAFICFECGQDAALWDKQL